MAAKQPALEGQRMCPRVGFAELIGITLLRCKRC
jgi:hypothetical protein